jgi:hypothetical protein
MSEDHVIQALEHPHRLPPNVVREWRQICSLGAPAITTAGLGWAAHTGVPKLSPQNFKFMKKEESTKFLGSSLGFGAHIALRSSN